MCCSSARASWRRSRGHLESVLSDRSGAAVFVGGEAGVGKTALLRGAGIAVRFPGARLWAACEPLLAPRPLGPFSDLAEELGAPLGEAVRDGGTPHEVVTCLLEEVRTAGPTLLVLEDLHWADEGTSTWSDCWRTGCKTCPCCSSCPIETTS